MIFRFIIVSDEVDNFRREIKIDADDTFYDLFKTIVECVNYSDKEMASFFICSDNWRRKEEITLVEMDTDSDEDSFIMEDTILSDFLEDEKQKLVFVFDYINDRAFYIELSEIIPGKSLKSPICTLSQGKAPLQSVELDDTTVVSNSISDIDDTFFGDESFNPDELESEGFEDIEDIAESFGESDLI